MPAEETSQDKEPLVNAEDEHTEENAADTLQEIGGVKGPEPTRFGDWEKNGRCIDFSGGRGVTSSPIIRFSV